MKQASLREIRKGFNGNQDYLGGCIMNFEKAKNVATIVTAGVTLVCSCGYYMWYRKFMKGMMTAYTTGVDFGSNKDNNYDNK